MFFTSSQPVAVSEAEWVTADPPCFGFGTGVWALRDYPWARRLAWRLWVVRLAAVGRRPSRRPSRYG